MTEITMTVREMTEVFPALQAISQRRLPSRQAYRAMKLTRKLESEFKEFQEQKLKLIQEHGAVENEEKPGQWAIPKEDVEAIKAFDEALKPILDEQVTLTGVAKIVVDELVEVDIEPALLFMADPVIVESESDKE